MDWWLFPGTIFDSPASGGIWQCLETFLLVPTGGRYYYWSPVEKTRGAAQYLTMHRTVPPTTPGIIPLKLSGVLVETPETFRLGSLKALAQ